jgi:5-hydroxyisourate hydrolase
VLDTARGLPARGMLVTVQLRKGEDWVPIGGGTTNDDGRVPGLVPEGSLDAGTYRFTFATGDWFEAEGIQGFYPEVTVECEISDGSAHHHVPLLISPYGYSTYRGS